MSNCLHKGISLDLSENSAILFLLLFTPMLAQQLVVPQTGIRFGENQVSKKMYVGNLSFEATEEQVRDLFTPYGTVESISMITDHMSGQFRGFCFIEMETSAANAAIEALDSKEIDGRTLKVNEARPREARFDGQRSGDNQRGGYGRSR